MKAQSTSGIRAKSSFPARELSWRDKVKHKKAGYSAGYIITAVQSHGNERYPLSERWEGILDERYRKHTPKKIPKNYMSKEKYNSPSKASKLRRST